MPIYDLLTAKKDVREHHGSCRFNGYLEDYLGVHEETLEKERQEVLEHLLDANPKMKICVDLELNINKDAVANQIINYRDSFKLPEGMIRCPMVIYDSAQEQQRAMILVAGKEEAYVMAKALYFVMSEPENEYEGTRNEIISMCIDLQHEKLLEEAIQRFFWQDGKAGIVQRWLDMEIFTSYEDMYACAKTIAEKQRTHLKELLSDSEDEQHSINQIIVIWFLMKKFSYVQYMMDKNALYKRHDGSVKKQRQAAKEKCDSIAFVSYTELWKLVKESHV